MKPLLLEYAVTIKPIGSSQDGNDVITRHHEIGTLMSAPHSLTICSVCNKTIGQGSVAARDLSSPILYCFKCIFPVGSFAVATLLARLQDDLTVKAVEKVLKKHLVELRLHLKIIEFGDEFDNLLEEMEQVEQLIHRLHPEDVVADAKREAKYGVGL